MRRSKPNPDGPEWFRVMFSKMAFRDSWGVESVYCRQAWRLVQNVRNRDRKDRQKALEDLI